MINEKLFDPEANPLGDLTLKQREVLDLLIEHKTSKRISRMLGISPHTVDQRLTQARDKLGAGNRGEAAQAYRRLRSLYEPSIYQFPYMEKNGCPFDPGADTDEAEPITVPPLPASLTDHQVIADYRVGSELFEGRWGTLARLVAILVIALFLVLLVLGGVSMFVALSHLPGL